MRVRPQSELIGTVLDMALSGRTATFTYVRDTAIFIYDKD